VPLSEHEQRLLEQIERALYAEDPKFASAVRHTDLRSHHLRRIRRTTVLFVVGLGMLLAGVVLQAPYQIPVGVGGFIVMLVAALIAVLSFKRLRDSTRPRLPAVARRRVFERIEERWRRRRGEDSF